jgi:hypothetical protein
MRRIEDAHSSLLVLVACSYKARPGVACRRTATLLRAISLHTRYGDSLHIHSFHPTKKERE